MKRAEKKAEVGNGKTLAFGFLSFTQSLFLLLAYNPQVYNRV